MEKLWFKTYDLVICQKITMYPVRGEVNIDSLFLAIG